MSARPGIASPPRSLRTLDADPFETTGTPTSPGPLLVAQETDHPGAGRDVADGTVLHRLRKHREPALVVGLLELLARLATPKLLREKAPNVGLVVSDHLIDARMIGDHGVKRVPALAGAVRMHADEVHRDRLTGAVAKKARTVLDRHRETEIRSVRIRSDELLSKHAASVELGTDTSRNEACALAGFLLRLDAASVDRTRSAAGGRSEARHG